MNRLWRKIPRWLRFALDALLALALLTAVYTALGCPPKGALTRFRRAEKASLAGPSEILDDLALGVEWPRYAWERLLIGDDGEEVFLFFYRRGAGGASFIRWEKQEGMLLRPLPESIGFEPGNSELGEMVVPLLLFADNSAAVKATVEIRFSETWELTLTQVRGELAKTDRADAYSREGFFLLGIPLARELWGGEQGLLAQNLLAAYDPRPCGAGFPAVIRLYDAEDRLLETREWVL